MAEWLKYDQELAVTIELDGLALYGNLYLPTEAEAIVVFAHGSSSSRLSPRNQYVAEVLNRAGLGTLLFDLLTTAEERVDQQTAEYRFNIVLLAQRLVQTTDWVLAQKPLAALKIGYFGASTGAAAALIAAAARAEVVDAVVSRGGRPDLAADALISVEAATLLIIGGLDEQVIELNRAAQMQMAQTTQTELTIVPGATHLFEEPGKLEQVAELALTWFKRYLCTAATT